VSAFGQVFGLLCSAKVNYDFWRKEHRKVIDHYCVEMAETDEWENSDYLRLFFYKMTHLYDEETGAEETTKKMIRTHLQTGRTYRLGFAVKFGSLPVFYWRQSHSGHNRYGRELIQYQQRGFIDMPRNMYHDG